MSDETRKKISEANKRRFQDPEARAKLAAFRLGTKLTEEHKQQISKGNKGKKKPPRSEEHCQKLSQVIQTEEQKKKMSEAAKKRWEKLKKNPNDLKTFLDYRNQKRGIISPSFLSLEL
jgi:TPP-dependent indolepyruvate ferredoxin oxidoreductase alpha subunit